MSEISRREVLGYLAAVPFAFTYRDDPEAVGRAARAVRRVLAESEAGPAQEVFVPEFFTEHEWRTVRILVDLVIPRDERSGSATDAGVPEFMDFMMIDRPQDQDEMREGLAWLDGACRDRFGRTFVDSSPEERTQILDQIAWPDRAPESMREGVRFFNMFRDLTASGFWTSQIGIADLEYIGNYMIPRWEGCPEPALRKLGVSYEGDWSG